MTDPDSPEVPVIFLVVTHPDLTNPVATLGPLDGPWALVTRQQVDMWRSQGCSVHEATSTFVYGPKE